MSYAGWHGQRGRERARELNAVRAQLARPVALAAGDAVSESPSDHRAAQRSHAICGQGSETNCDLGTTINCHLKGFPGDPRPSCIMRLRDWRYRYRCAHLLLAGHKELTGGPLLSKRAPSSHHMFLQKSQNELIFDSAAVRRGVCVERRLEKRTVWQEGRTGKEGATCVYALT